MDKLDRAYKESWYTITGAGGDIEEWKTGYANMMRDRKIGVPKEWIHFTGKEMNEKYELEGDVRYQDDLNFLAFSLDGLDINRLSFFKIRMRDRWFDDIVDNNARRN